MKGEICGTGSCIPVQFLCNQELSKLVDTSDSWIQERTGVQYRHIVTGETTVSMAAEAGKRALENAGISASDVEMILVATISSNVVLPCTACEVQKILGAEGAVCFDLNAACSGFTFAYNTAQAYIASGMYQNILIIGSESLSNLVNWQDRGTCILFGDGAGAAVVRAVPGVPYRAVAHSDGWSGKALVCETRQSVSENLTRYLQNRADFHSDENNDQEIIQQKEAIKSEPEVAKEPVGMDKTYIQMDGREVFQFAVKKVTEAVGEVLRQNSVAPEEIDLFILHQANKRIVEAVAKRLGIGIEKFPMNLQKYGNTSSASIPILLDELNREGVLRKGQKLVMAGFGAGLSWGADILDWNL